VQSPRPTPTLVYETAGRFFVHHSVYTAEFYLFSGCIELLYRYYVKCMKLQFDTGA